MRVFAVALLVAGCSFHVDGTAPPQNGVASPGNPGGNDPGNGNGGAGGNPSDPGSPPSSGTPTPPPAPDMASAPVTSSPDMAMHGPQPPMTVHVGQACNGDPDCMEPDLKCFHSLGKGGSAVGLPGGYCSKPCDSKVPCPTGSECIATVYGAFCMNICPSGGCRTGYACCESVNACGLDQFCSGGQGGG